MDEHTFWLLGLGFVLGIAGTVVALRLAKAWEDYSQARERDRSEERDRVSRLNRIERTTWEAYANIGTMQTDIEALKGRVRALEPKEVEKEEIA